MADAGGHREKHLAKTIREGGDGHYDLAGFRRGVGREGGGGNLPHLPREDDREAAAATMGRVTA